MENRAAVFYGFGDASGVGFGMTVKNASGPLYKGGTWTMKEESSSNYRELANLVESITE